MTNHVRRRELQDAVDAALGELAGAERYRRTQRAVARRARGGFRVPRRDPGFVGRVTRLLNPF
jgi:hypothetical protein